MFSSKQKNENSLTRKSGLGKERAFIHLFIFTLLKGSIAVIELKILEIGIKKFKRKSFKNHFE